MYSQDNINTIFAGIDKGQGAGGVFSRKKVLDALILVIRRFRRFIKTGKFYLYFHCFFNEKLNLPCLVNILRYRINPLDILYRKNNDLAAIHHTKDQKSMTYNKKILTKTAFLVGNFCLSNWAIFAAFLHIGKYQLLNEVSAGILMYPNDLAHFSKNRVAKINGLVVFQVLFLM